MKVGLRVALGVLATVLLVVLGLSAGWFLWGRHLWTPASGPADCGAWSDVPRSSTSPWSAAPGGMMGRGLAWTGADDCVAQGGTLPPAASGLSIDQARDAVEEYVSTLGGTDLEIAEVMEFEENYYAIVREHDTGIGAMELLVDKLSGTVGPEMGPNMMWNERYGMHRGRGSSMMNRSTGGNVLTEQQAIESAQRWLDTNMPGVAAEEHADRFYGYYAIHTTRDGEIDGMLSVHGVTGQAWYHTWHGAFIQMIETEPDQH